MNEIHVQQLKDVSVDEVHSAFRNAFADYVEPFNLTVEQLKYMLERRGCDLNLSFGAFCNNELVGFILNGVGEWKANKTAYDTGTGTVPEFRKQGIATRIFNESLPVLREHNIDQYLLEVIKTNTGAYDLYRKAGFEVVRELDYYVFSKQEIKNLNSKIDADYKIQRIRVPDWNLLKSFWDFEPSWQNSIDSILRKMDYFTLLGIFDKDDLVGYGIIENHSGDIPQLAIHKSYRRKGLATKLMNDLIEFSKTEDLQIINSAADDKSFKEFTKGMGLVSSHGQYEMLLNLS